MARPPWTLNDLTIPASQSKTGTVQVYYTQPRAVYVPAGTQGSKLRFHFGAPVQAGPADPPTAGTFGPLVDGNGNMITVALAPGAWTDVRGLIPDTVFCQIEAVGSDGSTPQTQSADRTLQLITGLRRRRPTRSGGVQGFPLPRRPSTLGLGVSTTGAWRSGGGPV